MTAGLVAGAVVLLIAGIASGSSSDHVVVPPLTLGTKDQARAAMAGFRAASSDATYLTQAQLRAGIARVAKRRLPVFCGGLGPYAALTFDDGPTPLTHRLVALLRESGVSATFFNIGRKLVFDRSSVQDMESVGTIADHTWEHPQLSLLKKPQIRFQIFKTQKVIDQATGKTGHDALKLVRPPYGAIDPLVTRTITKAGFGEMLWSADTQDALGAPEQRVAEYGVQGIGPGAIVLMHDGHETTLEALRKAILPAARRSRLTFVTLPELLAINPPSDAQLAAGPRGCAHAGERNVTGLYFGPGERLGAQP